MSIMRKYIDSVKRALNESKTLPQIKAEIGAALERDDIPDDEREHCLTNTVFLMTCFSIRKAI